MLMPVWLLVPVVLIGSLTEAKVFNFETDGGAIPGDDSWKTVWKNGAALNASFQALKPGDVLLVPGKTFYLMGGVQAKNLDSVQIRIDGTLEFASTTLNAERYVGDWPRKGSHAHVLECMEFDNLKNVTFTSSGEGTLNGAGAKWWGIPGIGYLRRAENRPRLLHIRASKDVLIERLFLKDSPYWSFLADNITNLEVRYSRVEVRRTSSDRHSIIDLSAFNTDGFDFVSCDNVWVHDASVWNQDDCFDVKDGTSNVVIERVNASGFGLTIGSIGRTNVRNITFRDAYMHHTVKGIYLKFRGDGNVSDVTFENIVMDEPEQFAVWIGPAQQCDGCSVLDLCSGGTCSLCWPQVPHSHCHAPSGAQYANITLRNITINDPKQSAGVLLANVSLPMQNVVFDNVVVNNPASKPWGDDGYYCKNVNGVALGTTSPVPPCLKDLTHSSNLVVEDTSIKHVNSGIVV